MSELIFSSEFFSLFGARYKVELTGENYTGLDTDIVTGSGNNWEVAKDWTDYLQNTQDVTLTDTGAGTQAAIVQSFSYDSGTDITTIELNFAFDVAFDRITSDTFFPSFAPEINKLDTDWEGEGDIFLKALKPSSTTIEYNNAPDTAFFDRFFELFLNSNDDELKVQVFKFDSGFELEWVGNLVHDLMEYDDTSASVPYTFKVIDGIDMLKDVPYDEALTGASEQPLIAHIITILSKINTAQFWGPTDAYIRECIEYTSNEVPGLGIADSSLEYSFLDDRHFIDRKAQDTNEPLDSYDSLKAILELMSCRLFQAQGIWWIMQIRNFDNPTSIVFREFTTSIGAPSSQSQFNHKKTVGTSLREKDMVHMSNGVFAYEEGLLNTKLIVNKANEIYTDTDNTIITVSSSVLTSTRTYDLGHVYGGVGTGANIRVEFLVQELANTQAGYNLKCELEIFVNNRYIKGGDGLDPFWGDDAIQVNRFWFKRVHQVGAGNRTKVIFETPEIPFSLDGVTLKLTWRYRGNTSGAESFFSIFNPKIFFPNDENPEEIVVGNPNTQFTKELDLGELIIDDLNRFTSIAILMVDDEFTTVNPRNLVEAETWDADFDTDDSLAVTRATEAMSLQFKPIEKIQRKVEGTYYGFNSLSYNDKIYAFNGFRFNYLMDEYEGTWFEIATARTSVAIDQIIKKFPQGTDVPHAGGEPKGWANNTRNDTIVLTTAAGTTTAGTIGTININATGHERIKAGDTIQVIHPITNSVVETFVVSTDVGAADVVIGIVESTIEFDITDEMVVVFKKGEVVESNIVRADTFVDKTTGGIISVAGSNTEIQYNDNGSSGASPSFTWNDSLKELGVNGEVKLLSNNEGIVGVTSGAVEASIFKIDGSNDVNIGLRSGITSDAVIWCGSNASDIFFRNHQDNSFLGNIDGGTGKWHISGSAITATARLQISGGTALISALRLSEQAAVNIPNEGDIYQDQADNKLKFFNGVVLDILSVAGSDTHIQFNNGGIRDGSSNLTWDGTDLDVLGRVHITRTTEQLRIAYDVSNFLATTVDSTGDITYSLFGTVPEFTFNNPVTIKGDIDITGIEASLILTGQRSGFKTGLSASVIYQTDDDGGIYPFDAVGSLVLQSRTNSARDIVFVTGNGGIIRGFITGAGVWAIGYTDDADLVGGNILEVDGDVLVTGEMAVDGGFAGEIAVSDTINPTWLVNLTDISVIDGQNIGRIAWKVNDANAGGVTETGQISMEFNDNTASGPSQGTAGEGADILFSPGLRATTGQPMVLTEAMRIDKNGDLYTHNRILQATVTTLDTTSTPTVIDGNLFKTGGTTSITDFDNGVVGQTIQILAEHTITITDGTPIQLSGGSNFNMVSGNTLTLTMFNDQIWHEIART